ncbi:MAG: hypothetical protein ACRQFF_12425 [Sphaerochaeta sp.]
MKKILTLLLIASLAITGIFADSPEVFTVSESDGTLSGTGSWEVTLQAIVGSNDYEAKLTYGTDTDPSINALLADTLIDSFIIDEASLQTTDVFGVVFYDGKLETATDYEITITPTEFISTDTSPISSGITPALVEVTGFTLGGTESDTITTTINAAYNADIDLAAFKLDWTGDTTVPVGTYQSTVTIAVATV